MRNVPKEYELLVDAKGKLLSPDDMIASIADIEEWDAQERAKKLAADLLGVGVGAINKQLKIFVRERLKAGKKEDA
jgi:hypothetical protein